MVNRSSRAGAGTRTSVPNPVRRRPLEWAVGRLFGIATRTWGLRPSMIPEHMRRQLSLIGIDAAALDRVLANVRSLTDWPYAWEAEGDQHLSHGRVHAAAASYYVAQRVLITDTPLKRRLYRLARNTYQLVPQATPIECVSVSGPVNRIAGYLQVPERATADRPVAAIVMVPGITVTKEEMHPVSDPFVRRGYAVCRIDNPRYGDTTGLLAPGSEENPACIVRHLRTDPRIDPERIHLLGMSLGGYWALHSATRESVASTITVCSPFQPEHYLHLLPAMNQTALQHMTGAANRDELEAFGRYLALGTRATAITSPLRIFHAGRDRTIPVQEAHDLAGSVSCPVALTIYERDHHTCLEHLHDIIADTLEWLPDPARAAARHRAAAEIARLEPSTTQAGSRSDQPESYGEIPATSAS